VNQGCALSAGMPPTSSGRQAGMGGLLHQQFVREQDVNDFVLHAIGAIGFFLRVPWFRCGAEQAIQTVHGLGHIPAGVGARHGVQWCSSQAFASFESFRYHLHAWVRCAQTTHQGLQACQCQSWCRTTDC